MITGIQSIKSRLTVLEHTDTNGASGGPAVLCNGIFSTDNILKITMRSLSWRLTFQLQSKRYCVWVSGFYSPPENSVWGRDAQSFYAHIMTQIYMNYEYDIIYICGDFNARIGPLSNVSCEIDDIPLRHY